MRSSPLLFPFLLAGAAASLPAQNTLTMIRQHFGTQLNEFRGESVVGLGDIDRDGVDDYLVGGSRFSNSNGTVGRVDAHSGATGARLYSVVGTNRDMRLGYSLARTGDQNNDGVADWVAGAPFDDSNGVDAGRVLCFSGRTGALLWQTVGAGANQFFGWSVASVDRSTTFSVHDIVAGAPGNGSVPSSFSVLLGRSGVTTTRREAPAAHRLGTSVYGGVRQFAVGAPGSGPNAEGSARFFSYSGSLLSELEPYLSFDRGAGIGASITAVERPDGRHFAIGGTGNASIPGRVDLVRVSSTISTRVTSVMGTRPGDRFGFSVASGADVDADGVDDLLVGAPEHSIRGPRSGAVFIYSGRTMTLNRQEFGDSGVTYGWTVRFLGDLDGDGLADIALGSPLASTSLAVGAGRLDIVSLDLRGTERRYGTGCASGSMSSDLMNLHPGGSVDLTAGNVIPGTASGVWLLGVGETNVDLTAIGMPRCFLLTSPLVTEPFQSVSGFARLSLPIPADPGLTRAMLNAQYALLVPGANRAGVLTSRGLEVVLGNR